MLVFDVSYRQGETVFPRTTSVMRMMTVEMGPMRSRLPVMPSPAQRDSSNATTTDACPKDTSVMGTMTAWTIQMRTRAASAQRLSLPVGRR